MFELAKNDSPKSTFSEAMSTYTNQLWPELLQRQLNRYAKLMGTTPDKLPRLQIGDFVLCWKPKMVDGKLSTLWEGPFRITKHYSNVSYHLVNPETGLKIRRHIRHIRPIGKLLNKKLLQKYPEAIKMGDESKIMEEGGGSESYDFKDFPFN